MSIIENVVQAVVAKFKSQGAKVKTKRLSSDWKLAEKCFDEFLKGSILLGLNDLPYGTGNLLLFTWPQNPQKVIAQLAVEGCWIWIDSSISTFTLKDDNPFPKQDHSLLISQTAFHVGQTITAFKLWKLLPHLALEFSDGTILVIHGNNGQHESWGFDKRGSDTIGVYALPGGPISVG